MPLIYIDWTAECIGCGKQLGRETLVCEAPDPYGFDTSECKQCYVEICDNCGDTTLKLHTDCESEYYAEEDEYNKELKD